MNITPPFSRSDVTHMILSLVMIGTLSGCVGFVGRPRQGCLFIAPLAVAPVVVAAVPVAPVPVAPAPVVVEAYDYIYYPAYEVYYSTHRQEYIYLQRGIWVASPLPRGVAPAVLVAGPSVRMLYHDAPGNHHAAIVRQYPKNWSPHGNAR